MYKYFNKNSSDVWCCLLMLEAKSIDDTCPRPLGQCCLAQDSSCVHVMFSLMDSQHAVGALHHIEEPASPNPSPAVTSRDNPQLLMSRYCQDKNPKGSCGFRALMAPPHASSHSTASSPASSCSWACALAAAAVAPPTCCPTRCAAWSTSCTCRR